MAAHIISEEGFGVPGSTNEMFYLLEENSGIVATSPITVRMRMAGDASMAPILLKASCPGYVYKELIGTKNDER